MSIYRNNLLPRFQLVKTALTRRFIYSDVLDMSRAYGIDYDDIRADCGPFDFVEQMLPLPVCPDFGAMLGDASRFTPADAPSKFNSEPSVARFLAQLVFHRRAKTVIELGCFVGWTTAHIAAAMHAHGEGTIFAVDYMQTYLDVMRQNLARYGLESHVSTIAGMSLDPAVLNQLPAKADVIFLDTSHAYPATRDEILSFATRLVPGGCLVLHDSMSASGVRKSILEVRDRFHVHTFGTEFGNGVTVLRNRTEPTTA